MTIPVIKDKLNALGQSYTGLKLKAQFVDKLFEMQSCVGMNVGQKEDKDENSDDSDDDLSPSPKSRSKSKKQPASTSKSCGRSRSRGRSQSRGRSRCPSEVLVRRQHV